jgi:hypothetical protein
MDERNIINSEGAMSGDIELPVAKVREKKRGLPKLCSLEDEK